ncbi:MAG: hypothetical protein JSV19_14075 [Phycisphaerales bacterium]|nr:MAG: hypothetical protein JSV19_14075 [Phycisphaerales bacterium]
MAKSWTRDELLALMRAYQPACVVAAAAELDVFTGLSGGPMTAAALASALGADVRGVTVLLDALAAMDLLDKHDGTYTTPPTLSDLLTETGSGSTVLAMVRHQANCLRRWGQLAQVTRAGKPAERTPSIRGEAADQASFIGAMHDVSGPVAGALVTALGTPRFRRLLDVGGASGTWTIAFLQAVPDATADLFDLPDVIPLARRRIGDAGLTDRVTFGAGDFTVDALPAGADFAWISAIVHQNSRQENRDLFAKVRSALVAGGQIMIRDIVMDESRTRPAAGAMFAVNMLVATQGGGTYTFAELREDLTHAGFADVTLLRHDEWMDSIIRATKRE